MTVLTHVVSPDEFVKARKARQAADRAKVRARRVKVIRFTDERWVELEYTRDDGVRERAVFKLAYQ